MSQDILVSTQRCSLKNRYASYHIVCTRQLDGNLLEEWGKRKYEPDRRDHYRRVSDLEHITPIINHDVETKPPHKMSPDVRMKSLCFMFINYRQYILQLGGGKIQFAAPQDKKFFLGCSGFSLVCGFNVCLSFLQRENRVGAGSQIQFTKRIIAVS